MAQSQAFPALPQFSQFMKPCRFEGETQNLEVVGTIPPEVRGTFYRVMPDPQLPPRVENDPVGTSDIMTWSVMANAGLYLSSGSMAMAMSALSKSNQAECISNNAMFAQRNSSENERRSEHYSVRFPCIKKKPRDTGYGPCRQY